MHWPLKVLWTPRLVFSTVLCSGSPVGACSAEHDSILETQLMRQIAEVRQCPLSVPLLNMLMKLCAKGLLGHIWEEYEKLQVPARLIGTKEE